MGLDRWACVSLKYCVVWTGALKKKNKLEDDREKDAEADGFQNSIF